MALSRAELEAKRAQALAQLDKFNDSKAEERKRLDEKRAQVRVCMYTASSSGCMLHAASCTSSDEIAAQA
jgi:hypothetical protein